MNDKVENWYFYHLVQPYFFAHHHFHQRKVDCLRDAGYVAHSLAIVPESLYRAHAPQYEQAIASGYTKIIRVANERKVNRALLLFMLRELLMGRRLLIHVLRNNPAPLIWLQSLPGLAGRIRYVLEYEGDLPSELVYQQTYVEGCRPPDVPPAELLEAYDKLMADQIREVTNADGLVLMSQEHIDLWQARLGREIRACCLPTLADSRRVHFDQHQRVTMRQQLHIEDRLVFVYTGNLVCKWQRLEAICRLLTELRQFIPSTWLLALVRVDDLPIAEEVLRRYGLAECATVMNVPAYEMGRYLSAADVGLFLRHDHPMNRVVTSGKLGEYLAAGLPVLTTGANAEILNDYIRHTASGVFVSDDLPVDAQLADELSALTLRFVEPESRVRLSHEAESQFNGENDAFAGFVPFIRAIINDDGSVKRS